MSLNYRLSIAKIEDNPEKDAVPRYGYQPAPATIETRMVEAVISEPEFDCIKQALLKVWK